jgi:uncharacterized protein (TIGR02118 family)
MQRPTRRDRTRRASASRRSGSQTGPARTAAYATLRQVDDRSCSYVIRPHSAGLVQFAANAWLERATAVWGAVTVRAMHRLLVLYPPPSDPDHFRSYYEDTHLPLAAKLPGLRAYRYSFDVAAGEGESPYYCVFEADFDDAAALSAARESPEGQAVRADVPNYATGGAVVLNYELRAD